MSSLRISAFLLTLGVASQAGAALGGDAASVVADTAAFGAAHEVVRAPNCSRSQACSLSWEVHALRLPSGTLVREFVQGGKVFAVAWGGPVMPDLRRLLGAYFNLYVNSPQGRGTGHHHMRIVSTPDWVVQSGGHQDAFVGRAWLTTQVPAGFDLQTVRAW